MNRDGFRIEYSDDEEQVCIIPNRLIPFLHFNAILEAFISLGYVWLLPADQRRGYILSKNKPNNDSEK